jgi:hypothetical protein
VTVGELFIRLVAALRAEPPKLVDNVIEEKTFGDWLARHFTLDEVEVLRDFEDRAGASDVDSLIRAAFICAGLPEPKRK